jgi:predicted  nucleic acid-binding Zn-ribbon protein
LDSESALLREGLDAARSELTGLREANARRIQAEADLQQMRAQLATAETSVNALSATNSEFKQQLETLRKDLTETKTGRELLALRKRLSAADEERQRMANEARQLTDELQASSKAHLEVKTQLEATVRQLHTVEEKIAAVAESQVQHDNDILRGIVARQNSELEARFAELKRLKRARLLLRSMYLLFGTAIVALGIVVAKLIPELGF